MVGTAIVAPEAEPIEDTVLEGACAIAEIDSVYDCAKDAMHIIQQGEDCAQTVYDTTQYVESYDEESYFTQDNGNFAGKLY